MPEDVSAMSAELAGNPDSLVFLQLGEKLRLAGQLDAAARVATAGVERHPVLAEARDLYARILADVGRLRDAQALWTEALVLDPRNLGARKGLGYLSFRAGDWDAALDHLESALAVDPSDRSIVGALSSIRTAFAELEIQAARLEAAVFSGLEGAEAKMLLADDRGLVLGGRIADRHGQDRSQQVSAHLAGIAQEAERACRILNLGSWQWIAGEATEGNIHVTQPTERSLLILVRDSSIPSGRMIWIAERAAAAARKWLEEQAS